MARLAQARLPGSQRDLFRPTNEFNISCLIYADFHFSVLLFDIPAGRGVGQVAAPVGGCARKAIAPSIQTREGALPVRHSLVSDARPLSKAGDVGSSRAAKTFEVGRRIRTLKGLRRRGSRNDGSRGSDVAKFWEKGVAIRRLCRTGSDASPRCVT